jgi:hypothetical protein
MAPTSFNAWSRSATPLIPRQFVQFAMDRAADEAKHARATPQRNAFQEFKSALDKQLAQAVAERQRSGGKPSPIVTPAKEPASDFDPAQEAFMRERVKQGDSWMKELDLVLGKARQGDRDAQASIGALLLKGDRGIKRDLARAALWLDRAGGNQATPPSAHAPRPPAFQPPVQPPPPPRPDPIRAGQYLITVSGTEVVAPGLQRSEIRATLAPNGTLSGSMTSQNNLLGMIGQINPGLLGDVQQLIGRIVGPNGMPTSGTWVYSPAGNSLNLMLWGNQLGMPWSMQVLATYQETRPDGTWIGYGKDLVQVTALRIGN